MERLEWENISTDTYRLKVIRGWLVSLVVKKRQIYSIDNDRVLDGDNVSVGMTFVPDPLHEWKL